MSFSVTSSSRPRLRRFSTGAALLTATGLLVLSGCGSDSSSTAAGADPSTQASRAGGQQAGANGGNRLVGLIADVSGKTVQVQSTDSQTAVSWSSKTTFTAQVSTSASAIKVGTCVSAQSASTTASASATVTATAVAVSAATKGECAGGFGGMGQGAGGRPSGMPSGAPSGGPTGMPSGAAGRGRPVSGKVTAVSGSTLTVAVTTGSDPTQSYTVNTTGSTTYTTTKSATSKALKVGSCATVSGKADSTGAVAATAIGVRPATNGACAFGAGARGNG